MSSKLDDAIQVLYNAQIMTRSFAAKPKKRSFDDGNGDWDMHEVLRVIWCIDIEIGRALDLLGPQDREP